MQPFQTRNTVDLLREGATVPFIARYRKERTGELDEVAIRTIEERWGYYTELAERKADGSQVDRGTGKAFPGAAGPDRGDPTEDRAGRSLSAL